MKPAFGRQVSPEEASARIAAINEPYKQEILDGILARTPDAPITVYHIGDSERGEHWWDLCGGPHVASTGKINPAAVDLESLAGAACRRCARGCLAAMCWGEALQPTVHALCELEQQ